MSESVFELLRRRYPAPAWAFLEEVRNQTGYARTIRTADALAMSLYPSRGLHLHGFEVKVSRADWFRELNDPKKAEEIAAYCVGVDTRVLTMDLRWSRAGDLKRGDALVGFDEQNGPRAARRWRPSVVTGHRIERRPAFVVRTESGAALVCTADHKWLVGRGAVGHWDPVEWATTEEIIRRLGRKNRRVFLPKYFEPWSERSDYDAGFLAAALDGEGCLPDSKQAWRIQFAQMPNSFLDAVLLKLRQAGFAVQIHKSKPNGCINPVVCQGLPEVTRFLGQMRPPRLMDNWLRQFAARPREMRAFKRDRVVSVEAVGDVDIAVMSTSSETFIAEGFASHNCHFWWLVVDDADIVRDGELPATWGLLVRHGKVLKAEKEPMFNKEALPPSHRFLGAILRKVATTSTDQVRLDRARAEGKEQGYKDGIEHMRNVAGDGRLQKAHDELVAKVQKFEEASGVNVMHDWTRGTIAQAVKLFTSEWSSPPEALIRLAKEAADISKTCTAAVEELRKVLSPLKADEDAA